MAKKDDVPLYDELVKSPEFSDLDYEEKQNFKMGRKTELGGKPLEMQENISLQEVPADKHKKKRKKKGSFVDKDTPLYDEVVKSPEFSELQDEKSTPRRKELGAEPEITQEEILIDE